MIGMPPLYSYQSLAAVLYSPNAPWIKHIAEQCPCTYCALSPNLGTFLKKKGEPVELYHLKVSLQLLSLVDCHPQFEWRIDMLVSRSFDKNRNPPLSSWVTEDYPGCK